MRLPAGEVIDQPGARNCLVETSPIDPHRDLLRCTHLLPHGHMKHLSARPGRISSHFPFFSLFKGSSVAPEPGFTPLKVAREGEW